MQNDIYSELSAAFDKGYAAIRAIGRLAPAGGPHAKVFPPTYEGGKYAYEERLFQAVRSALIKNTETRKSGDVSSETAIQQTLSKALVSDRVIDIFAAAGLEKPDISILSDEFLAEVKDMPQKNLAFEMLRKAS